MGNISKKKHIFIILICCIILVLCVTGAALLLYYTERIPSFNSAVDTILSAPIVENEVDLIPSLPEGACLRDLSPRFIGVSENIISLEPFSFPRTAGAYSCILKDDGYVLECLVTTAERYVEQNILQKFLRMKTEIIPAEQRQLWSYTCQFPIVSTPCFSADSVIFITAEPRLIVLDLETGEIRMSVECPVYPDSDALLKDSIYYFNGRNGERYAFDFTADVSSAALEEYRIASEPAADISLQRVVSPNAIFTENLLSQLSQWLPEKQSLSPSDIEPVLIPSSGGPAAIRYPDYDVAVFSPEEQGLYTVGVGDNAGLWLQMNAVAAVFTLDGEMVQTSLDYVSDRPQITLHLSDTEVYYLVVAVLNKDTVLNNNCFFWIKGMARD